LALKVTGEHFPFEIRVWKIDYFSVLGADSPLFVLSIGMP
jgi:hypothetical protein